MPSRRLNSLVIGDPLHLKPGVLPYVKVRDWTFNGLTWDGKILLFNKEKNYTLEVTEDDIDWRSVEIEPTP